MKRKWFFNIFIFLSILLLLIGIGFFFEIEKSKKLSNYPEPPMVLEKDKFHITENTNNTFIRGSIVRIEDNFLLVEHGTSPKESELYNVQLSDNPVIYVDGELSDISKVKLGQTVGVTYSGEIYERYPSVAVGVSKISAVTEDVSLLNGTVMEINDEIVLIQRGENSDRTYKLSLSDETFVYMHGWLYSVGIIEVGQNVEVVYKEGTDGEVPRAAIVLIK